MQLCFTENYMSNSFCFSGHSLTGFSCMGHNSNNLCNGLYTLGVSVQPSIMKWCMLPVILSFIPLKLLFSYHYPNLLFFGNIFENTMLLNSICTPLICLYDCLPRHSRFLCEIMSCQLFLTSPLSVPSMPQEKKAHNWKK